MPGLTYSMSIEGVNTAPFGQSFNLWLRTATSGRGSYVEILRMWAGQRATTLNTNGTMRAGTHTGADPLVASSTSITPSPHLLKGTASAIVGTSTNSDPGTCGGGLTNFQNSMFLDEVTARPNFPTNIGWLQVLSQEDRIVIAPGETFLVWHLKVQPIASAMTLGLTFRELD